MNLATIQHLFAHDGPFVTLHLDVSRNTEDARQQLDSRWRTAVGELEQERVDPALIEKLGERVQSQVDLPGEVRRTTVAAEGEIVLDDLRTGHTTWPESTTLAPLPDLSGWLTQVDGQIPFVLVVADREGADVDFYRALSKPRAEHQEVHGSTLHLTKVPQGDWAQKQFQQRAENTWRANAREVADTVRSAAREHRPRVILLAGDARARREVAEGLKGVPCDIEEIEAGGRAEGSSEEALMTEVAEVLARLEAHDDQQVTERLLAASGQGTGAVRGLSDVLDALVKGQVEQLVLDLPAAAGLEVTPREHPGLTLPQRALNEPLLPADRVLVAAGAATDAGLRVLPKEQTHGQGVAALLRWDG